KIAMLFRRFILEKAVVRRLRRFSQIKQRVIFCFPAHHLGVGVHICNRIKICVNLRNLRIELPFFRFIKPPLLSGITGKTSKQKGQPHGWPFCLLRPSAFKRAS
ncbi:MAG: hypothetical protein OEV23_03640, partial [Gallionella sp.]|nr:hypothetical protein [Gallionella sp.]